jgi:hypothetical protein
MIAGPSLTAFAPQDQDCALLGQIVVAFFSSKHAPRRIVVFPAPAVLVYSIADTAMMRRIVPNAWMTILKISRP